MNSWSEQQRKREEREKESKDKEKISRETLGKYFYDLSKLTFTAMFLGGGVSLFMDYSKVNYWLLILFGAFTSMGLAYIGYRILK